MRGRRATGSRNFAFHPDGKSQVASERASAHAGGSGSSSAVSSSATAVRTSLTSAPRSSRSTACGQGQMRRTSMPGRRWTSRRPRPAPGPRCSGRAWQHALDGEAAHRPSQVACPAARHAHVHEPSGLALVALTKRGQVPCSGRARRDTPREPARGRPRRSRTRYGPGWPGDAARMPGACPGTCSSLSATPDPWPRGRRWRSAGCWCWSSSRACASCSPACTTSWSSSRRARCAASRPTW